MPDPDHRNGLCGVLVIDKPRGMISKDVSRWLQKFLGKKLRLGHVGTLDPGAEGVLPLLLGKATRVQDHLLNLPKTYECDVQLGLSTTTLDMDGDVTERMSWEHVESECLQQAASELEGDMFQRPPLYSAVKYKGRPLYDYARSGEAEQIEWEAVGRVVRVHSVRILGFSKGVVTFRARCGKGTYIRVLADELARKVGTLGTVTRLSRTESSGVTREQAFRPEEIEAHFSENKGLCEPYLTPLNKVEMGLPVLHIGEEECGRLLNGLPLILPESGIAPPVGLYNNDGFSLEQGTDILLMDMSGRAFGLGSGMRHSAGNMQVRLKRSLL